MQLLKKKVLFLECLALGQGGNAATKKTCCFIWSRHALGQGGNAATLYGLVLFLVWSRHAFGQGGNAATLLRFCVVFSVVPLLLAKAEMQLPF